MQYTDKSLFYIKMPDEYALTAQLPEFDSSIPLPLLLSSEKESFQPKDISEEMILAGMLNVFAYDRDNQHIEYYRDIFKILRPDIRKEMTNVAILKIKNGDFELAEELLLSLEGLFPDDMRTKLNLALLFDERSAFFDQVGAEDNGGYYTDKAEHFYTEVLAGEPPLPDAFFNAGYFFIRQKNYKKAKRLFETYIEIESSVTDASQERKAKAQDMLVWITGQALDDELFSSAFDAVRAGQPDVALEKVRQFLEHHPKVWHGWFLLGWALRCKERWEDARAAFLHCLDLGENKDDINAAYCDICNELAICLMELQDFDACRHWLINALEYEPENIKIISNLGYLALKEHNTEEAKGFFSTILAINPEDQLAAIMLEKIEKIEKTEQR